MAELYIKCDSKLLKELTSGLSLLYCKKNSIEKARARKKEELPKIINAPCIEVFKLNENGSLSPSDELERKKKTIEEIQALQDRLKHLKNLQ